MAIKRAAPQASVIEVLDRVLDRGIVIEVWLRVSVAGITLIDVDARVVVASIDTYVRQSDAVAQALFAPPPSPTPTRRPRRRQPRLRVRCDEGCTFIRSAHRRPKTVRCPADRARACPVAAIQLSA
jgi:hypothetical protein